jgi:Fur family transcriptional regulator, peroxide stress response regulator
MRRRSDQRERIFRHIQEAADHPTAREVFQAIKGDIPSLGAGNLYRNLKILVEEGRLVIRQFTDGVERYDAITSAHYHLLCTHCGRVSDFTMPHQPCVEKEAQRHTKAIITGHTIQFTGLCAACAAGAPKKKRSTGGTHERK